MTDRETSINLREGWLVLEMIYSTGEEKWTFHASKPDYIDEVADFTTNEAKPVWVPGRVRRIMFVEVAP